MSIGKTKNSVSTNKIRRVDPANPDAAIIREAAAVIRAGGIVTYPTRSLYGIGADAFNAAAIRRIFEIKQRPVEKPILVLIESMEKLSRLVTGIPPAAEKLIHRFWPGRVTLVFTVTPELPKDLTAWSGKIAIRLPDHPVALALAAEVGGPITGTSANLSGEEGFTVSPPPGSRIAETVDLLLDAGALRGGPGSTVVDVTTDPPMVLREGCVPADEIFDALKETAP
jgi:L-threonylcarbamoyladenylate synthase